MSDDGYAILIGLVIGCCLVYLVANHGFAVIWDDVHRVIVRLFQRMLHGRPRPTQAIEPPWWEGLDDQVRRAIERGESDEVVRGHAEAVAVREWHQTHRRTGNHRPVPQRSSPVRVTRETTWTIAAGRAIVVDATPEDCPDCEWETVTDLAGTSTKVQTWGCSQHRRAR